MSQLTDKLLNTVISSATQLVIVADANNLFEYAEFIKALEEQKFNILKAADNLDVRIKFELEMRDKHERIILIAPPDYKPLPDIEECVHFVDVGLKQLFPRFDENVINGLGFTALENLYEKKIYENLSKEKTLEFVLDNIYQIDSSKLRLNKSPEEFLNILISVLFENEKPNQAVTDYLLKIGNRHFPELTGDLLQRDNFTGFLQKKWVSFINGSDEINFDYSSLQKNINHLFIVDRLMPVSINESKFNSLSRLFPFGIILDDKADEHFRNLIALIEEKSESLELQQDWFDLIQMFAKAMLISFKIDDQELKEKFGEVTDSVNKKFQQFIENKYEELFSRSGIKNPAVVSKILEHLKFHKAEKKTLFVIDGLNYWQWHLIADKFRRSSIDFKSGATFAFIPSITAWSRQSIFRGENPDLKMNNSKEDKMFQDYWKKQGFNYYQIEFEKIDLTKQSKVLNISDSVQLLGIVTNDLDEFMHGTHMGNLQLKQNTELWLEKGGFIDQIKQLKNLGYTIFITADHGSIEAKGVKNFKLKDKVGSISRSKRHIHFSNQSMLENFAEQNPSLDFGTSGLSAYLKNDDAFTTEDTTVVTHGGSHFWEVIIPFIEV